MDLQFYLKRPDATIVTTIFARITYEGGKLKYYVPEKINPQHWNPDTHKARETKKFPEFSEFNARLDNIAQTIKNTLRKFQNDNQNKIPMPAQLKELLDITLGKKTSMLNKDFFQYFEDFVTRTSKGERLSPKTKRKIALTTNKGYTTTLNHLKKFKLVYNRKIDFDTIDLQFHNDYIAYLTNKIGLSNNTIGDHIKRIIVILSDAKRLGMNVNPSFESGHFFKPSEETDNVYLDQTELSLLEDIDLANHPKLDRVRDLFLIGCYTGLRYSDYSTLKPEDFKDGFIEIKQTKTGKPVVIPEHPVVKKILDKYNGQLPRSISNQKTNAYLKDLGEMIPELEKECSKTYTKGGVTETLLSPKWKMISSHTARRSFATNEYLAGTPTLTIMAITGHTTEKMFMKYIKLTPKEHAVLLKMHWEKRSNKKEEPEKVF